MLLPVYVQSFPVEQTFMSTQPGHTAELTLCTRMEGSLGMGVRPHLGNGYLPDPEQ